MIEKETAQRLKDVGYMKELYDSIDGKQSWGDGFVLEGELDVAESLYYPSESELAEEVIKLTQRK